MNWLSIPKYGNSFHVSCCLDRHPSNGILKSDQLKKFTLIDVFYDGMRLAAGSDVFQYYLQLRVLGQKKTESLSSLLKFLSCASMCHVTCIAGSQKITCICRCGISLKESHDMVWPFWARSSRPRSSSHF